MAVEVGVGRDVRCVSDVGPGALAVSTALPGPEIAGGRVGSASQEQRLV